MKQRDLKVFGAREHNLKGVDAVIPRRSLTVVTGVSGSGKSSLAFDTIYAEGQRRYVESLSAYARQFLDQMAKPHVEHIEGLSPSISIEQKTVSRNPRSTVGTVTEIYDYLRLAFATVGTPHCTQCGRRLERQTSVDIVETAMALPEGTRLIVMAPVIRGRKGEYQALFQRALKDGIVRAKVDGQLVELDPEMKLRKQLKHDICLVMDRFIVRSEYRSRLEESIRRALREAEGLVTLEVMPDQAGKFPPKVAWQGERTFSESIGCPEHGPQIIELAPRMFSFNSRFGACTACNGLGFLPEVDMDRLIPDDTLSLEGGAVVPWKNFFQVEGRRKHPDHDTWAGTVLRGLCTHFEIPIKKPWKRLSKKHREILLEGIGEERFPIKVGQDRSTPVRWEGLLPRIRRQVSGESEDSEGVDFFMQFLRDAACPACGGARLKPESLAVKLGGLSIAEACAKTVSDAVGFFKRLVLDERQSVIARQPLQEVRDRLGFLENVGLGYLALDRHAGTLSGGEAQRIRLATQIGSQLVGVLYVLDEPSIGLHQRDNERLISTLCRLRDMGNTVLVVEHDEQTIRTADHVLDLGPGAGSQGGHLIAAGTAADLVGTPQSITGDYLAGRRHISLPRARRKPAPDRHLQLLGCTHNNLKSVDLRIPLGLLVGVSGVSGSGKSSLIIDTLQPLLSSALHGANMTVGRHREARGIDLLDKIIAVDQSPIGRTPRSNPATYTKVWDVIRELYASLPEAKIRGYGQGRFSFNVKGGRCETCSGDGMIRVEMNFLPNVYVPCEACEGRRFNRETLEVAYRGRNIADVLEMTISDALDLFSAIPAVAQKLRTLVDVGLGYLTLGQSATTLSGGEAQRVKLSKELSRRNTGRTLYILDEPTTGLHFEDVRKLVEVLNLLVEAGSTVIIIEHHLDVLKSCDWLIDLGPGGGDAGGEIIAQGPPETVAKTRGSETGRFLKKSLTT